MLMDWIYCRRYSKGIEFLDSVEASIVQMHEIQRHMQLPIHDRSAIEHILDYSFPRVWVDYGTCRNFSALKSNELSGL